MKLVVNSSDVEVDDRHAKTPLQWGTETRIRTAIRDAAGVLAGGSGAEPLIATAEAEVHRHGAHEAITVLTDTRIRQLPVNNTVKVA